MTAVVKFLAFLCIAVLLAAPAQAQTTARIADSAPAPDKAGLVRYWEETVRNDPHVVRFEKTKEEGLYDFETTFFPYKGSLRLLNAAITRGSDGYLDLYSGIIEIELPDAKEDFFKKYAASYGAWTRQNYFYYSGKKGTWFPASGLGEYTEDYYNSAATATPAPACPITSWSRWLRQLLPLGFLIVVVGLLLVFAKKQNKRIWDNHAKALEEQQRGLTMVEESLKMQAEQTQLLREILAALKK